MRLATGKLAAPAGGHGVTEWKSPSVESSLTRLSISTQLQVCSQRCSHTSSMLLALALFSGT